MVYQNKEKSFGLAHYLVYFLWCELTVYLLHSNACSLHSPKCSSIDVCGLDRVYLILEGPHKSFGLVLVALIHLLTF